MSNVSKTKNIQFAKHILSFLNDVAHCGLSEEEKIEFLFAFLTSSEMKSFSQRIDIVQLLKSGLTQRDISLKLKVGIATITRGSRTLQEHEEIFNRVLEKNKL